MSAPRGLTPAEQAAWEKLADSVTPLAGRRTPSVEAKAAAHGEPRKQADTAGQKTGRPAKPLPRPAPPPVAARASPAPPPPRRHFSSQLDSHWNRKLKAGRVTPDLTLDLHGHTLGSAHDRILGGLDQARAMGARVVLVVAGRERPVDPADRMERRGAIRAKLLDWLAASHHADAIAAVRRAHVRHGGEGALYLVLRRSR